MPKGTFTYLTLSQVSLVGSPISALDPSSSSGPGKAAQSFGLMSDMSSKIFIGIGGIRWPADMTALQATHPSNKSLLTEDIFFAKRSKYSRHRSQKAT